MPEALVRALPGQRVLVLAPHPDDESLATAGVLARAVATGLAVRVAFITDGDNAPWIQRVYEKRWKIGPEERKHFGELRRREALAAIAALGLTEEHAIFLGQPDQGITDALLSGGGELLRELTQLFEEFEPDLVLLPSLFDLHPDHSAMAVLTRIALDHCVRPPDVRLYAYDMHQRGFADVAIPPSDATALSDGSRFELALTSEEVGRKRAAISCYASQLSVHKQKFLGFASPHEYFASERACPPGSHGHSVRAAKFEGSDLHLEIRQRSRLGSFGASKLLLCSAPDGGDVSSFELALPDRSGEVEIRRHGGVIGAAELSRARVIVERGLRRVTLPLGSGVLGERLFIKIERRYGFFDECGWLELAVPALLARPSVERALSRRAREPVVCAVIPCYNVEALCGEVVHAAMREAEHVLVVDDGSSDGTGTVLAEIARTSSGRVRIHTLPKNCGKGVALLEAFRIALADTRFDVLVTLDGDGQHRASDIPRLVEAWRAGAQFVIGERTRFAAMPLRSRFGNSLTALLLKAVSGDCPKDTQSGFRAFDRRFVEKITREITGERYETELRILLLGLAARCRMASVPIPTVYLDGNKSSHFRPLKDSARIYRTLVRTGVPVLIAGRMRRHGY